MPWLGPEWDEDATLLLLQFMDKLHAGSKPSEALESVLPGTVAGAMLDRKSRAMGGAAERLVRGWGEIDYAERVAAMRRVVVRWKIKQGYVT